MWVFFLTAAMCWRAVEPLSPPELATVLEADMDSVTRVTDGDGVVFAEAKGSINMDYGVPMAGDARFNIGSNTKLFAVPKSSLNFYTPRLHFYFLTVESGWFKSCDHYCRGKKILKFFSGIFQQFSYFFLWFSGDFLIFFLLFFHFISFQIIELPY